MARLFSGKANLLRLFYPFGVLGSKELDRVSFEPVTIFYGGNGSGKTTALNVIADVVSAQRSAPYNRTSFWGQYVGGAGRRGLAARGARMRAHQRRCFDYMLDVRSLNEGIDTKRQQVFEKYLDAKHARFQMPFAGRLRPPQTNERRPAAQPVPLYGHT